MDSTLETSYLTATNGKTHLLCLKHYNVLVDQGRDSKGYTNKLAGMKSNMLEIVTGACCMSQVFLKVLVGFR